MPAEQEDVLGSTTEGAARPPLGWAAELRGFLNILIMLVYLNSQILNSSFFLFIFFFEMYMS